MQRICVRLEKRISFTYKPSRREKAKEYMKHVKQNLKEANLKIAQSTKKLKVSGELRKLRTKKSLAAPKALENYYSLRRIASISRKSIIGLINARIRGV